MKGILLTLIICLTCAGAARGAAPQIGTGPGQAQEPTFEESLPPLVRAAARGRLDEVRRLVKAGADVNERDGGLGLTPLMLAAGGGHLDVVKVLLAAGADPNAAGGAAHVGFFSVLTMAMARPHRDRVELIDTLVAAGARLNPPRSFPESPLDRAVRGRDTDLIKALLKRGADVNWEGQAGGTPLVTAVTASERDAGVIGLLLRAGARPNRPRLWVGGECVSILSYLDDPPRLPRGKNREEIVRLLRRSGARKYRAKSNDKPCKSAP